MTIRRCISATALTALLALSAGAADASETARFPPGACPGGTAFVGDIGLLYLQCVGATCSVDRRASIRPGSPADGTLLPGDVVLAVDGVPIASRYGGARLASLSPGRPVTLRIRRSDLEGSREMEVVLTPTAGCKGPQIARRR
ncbi:MAG TPA: PDZ domain-containing protein [Thermoanaerobaculia bacterium]|nr:PDZ domain-containing protein [Thermoanaerobaculia bacterium]